MTREASAVTLANGPTLSYSEQGDRSASALVLLPGPADSWRSYEPVLERLRCSTRTIAVSPRGHGDSEKPAAGYRVEDFAADVVSLLDALHIERAVLAGHSGSCLVARRVALDVPERIAGLVLEASPTTLVDDAGLVAFVESVVSCLEDPIDSDFARSFVVDTSSGEVAPEVLDQLVGELLKVPAHVWRDMFAGLLQYDDVPELARVAAPVLLIWGDRDGIVGRDMQEQLLTHLPCAHLLVYHGVGHTPRWEDPSRFAADVAAFVEQLLPARPYARPQPLTTPRLNTMQVAPEVIPYSGPRPSPARAWAPWVIVAAAVCALGNIVLCFLNLVERHYQQQRRTAHPPSPSRIHHTLSMIHTATNATLIAAIAFLVVGTVWSTKRRTRMRVARDGETGVEPALRTVLPIAYWTVWPLLGVSLLGSTQARAFVHSGMTVDDFISYRTYLAASHASRSIMWACWVAIVLRAMLLQERRETVPAPADTVSPPTSTALSDNVRAATRNGAVAMLAAGDPANQAARLAVVQAVRGSGMDAYDDQWLVHDLNTIDTEHFTSYLRPLNQALSVPGKETIVQQVAAVGLAGGPLTPVQLQVLEGMCAALGLGAAHLHGGVPPDPPRDG